MNKPDLKQWHLGSQNDALYIIDVPPNPSNDYPDHERDTGCELAICIHGLPDDKAAQIVAAHNAAVRELTEAKNAAITLWNGTGEEKQKADDVLRSLSFWLGQGSMWGTENLDYAEVEARIREGVETIVRVETGSVQAKLDAVMLEYCPDDMTAEQKANWAKHQQPVQA